MYAQVIVDIKHKEVNRLFDYKIPEEWIPFCVVGMRVLVNFNHQSISGIIMKISSKSKLEHVKEIEAMDSSMPIITPKQWSMIELLTTRYRILLAEALDIVIPSVFNIKFETIITQIQPHPVLDSMNLTFDKENRCVLKSKDKIFLVKLKQLEQKGIVRISLKHRVKKPLKDVVYYTYLGVSIKKFIRYTDILEPNKHYTKNELNLLGISNSGIQTLLKHQIVHAHTKTKDETISKNVVNKHSLDTNRKWIGHIESFLTQLKELIHYAKMREESLLILIPHVSLLTYFKKQLDMDLVIYSGHLTPVQKQKVIQKLEEPQCVIGSRSSIFLPFYQLKHIVVIHAEDSLYQLNQGVYYDTLDILETQFSDVRIVYQSLLMTPYIHEIDQKSKVLDKRIIPNVEVISMRDELILGNSTMISKRLDAAIIHTLKQKEKVFILHQRKGYHLVNTCRLCGFTSTCQVCQSPYHVNAQNKMMCPTCNHESAFEDTCKNGHERMMKPIGIGIDHVLQTFKKRYQDASVGVVVSETKNISETIDMHDIIIGTSAVFYDMEAFNDGLVAILIADILWHHFLKDITLQALIHILHMTQYGTPHLKHKTYIQTYDVHHEVMDALISQDLFLKRIYDQQEALMLPPKYMNYDIHIPAQSYLKAYQEGLRLKATLLKVAHVVGPRKVYEEDLYFTLTVKVKKSLISNVSDIFDTILYEVIKL